MKNAIKTFISLLVISAILVILSFSYAIEFSSFGVGMAKFSLAVIIVWTVDKFAASEVDTMKLIGGNPIAYSIFFMGLCILAAACISAS